MLRTFMHAKLHKARVTEANLHYVGSITIDEDLLDAVGIFENEKVQVTNNQNGARIETYAIKGERGSGVICLNGAAARHFQVGDEVIIMAYAQLTNEEILVHEPKVAVLDETNNIKQMLSQEIAHTIL
ncbi:MULTISPECIES: aspartate 1-decarboxylase [Exiguobacterium]|uniref:Aspartate 1-decarboxylase n=1 Tax=Exiguobacterium oxidotolerans TaxID=223958 RepID=A0A653ID61_9BACL|nr:MULTISPECIES: aspartate 1-decarboxylase [Exiguobacterium]ASI35646.1 aspartate 1-decarboxylase [Exiguobacterium sp. N4-1P]VWX37040.1 aspartate 1-decarboxylase [Exiguobacterium oxidotolerans]